MKLLWVVTLAACGAAPELGSFEAPACMLSNGVRVFNRSDMVPELRCDRIAASVDLSMVTLVAARAIDPATAKPALAQLRIYAFDGPFDCGVVGCTYDVNTIFYAVSYDPNATPHIRWNCAEQTLGHELTHWARWNVNEDPDPGHKDPRWFGVGSASQKATHEIITMCAETKE